MRDHEMVFNVWQSMLVYSKIAADRTKENIPEVPKAAM